MSIYFPSSEKVLNNECDSIDSITVNLFKSLILMLQKQYNRFGSVF